jgi:hypothetical protein
MRVIQVKKKQKNKKKFIKKKKTKIIRYFFSKINKIYLKKTQSYSFKDKQNWK